MLIEAPSDADNFLFFRPASTFTVTRVDCIVGASTSVQLTVQECDANASSCTSMASGTCSTTNTSLTVTDSAAASGNWMRVDVGVVTGTPGQVTVCVTLTQ